MAALSVFLPDDPGMGWWLRPLSLGGWLLWRSRGRLGVELARVRSDGRCSCGRPRCPHALGLMAVGVIPARRAGS